MTIKIGFVLSSSSRDPLPSTRIAVLNVLPLLRAAGFDPHIVFDPEVPTSQPDLDGLAERLIAERFQLVCFQKVYGPRVVAAARTLSAAGIKTASLVCDMVDVDMATVTDVTATVTEHLRQLYPAALKHKIHVVHDGIEHPECFKTRWSSHRGSRWRPLRAVLVTWASPTRLPVLGVPPSWLEVVVVGRYPPVTDTVRRFKEMWWDIREEPGLPRRLASLPFLLSDRIHRHAWHPSGVYKVMAGADIAILPIEPSSEFAPGTRVPAWRVKSENRLTLKMSMSLPVVATPIPSYERVVHHGHNGFLADSRAEWLTCLNALRDPQLRRSMGAEARRSVSERYSVALQAQRLAAVFRSVLYEGAKVLKLPEPRSAARNGAFPRHGWVGFENTRTGSGT